MSKIDVLLLANSIILAPHLRHGVAQIITAVNIFAMAYLAWWA